MTAAGLRAREAVTVMREWSKDGRSPLDYADLEAAVGVVTAAIAAAIEDEREAARAEAFCAALIGRTERTLPAWRALTAKWKQLVAERKVAP